MTPDWGGGQSRSRVAFQGDVGRLEEWTNRDLKESNKGKCKVLHLGQTNPLQLGISQLGSRCDGQGVGVLADTKQG